MGARNSVFIAMTVAALSLSACTRDPGRQHEGDVLNTEKVTGEQRDRGQGPSVNNIQGDESRMPREPASVPDQGARGDVSVPRDAKGIPGTVFPSRTETTGQQASSAGTEIGQPIDLAAYGYDKRDQFKTVMGARLDSLHQGIQALASQGRMPSSAKEAGGRQDQIKALEREHDQAKRKLDQVQGVKPENWDRFKNDFKNDVTKLENDYRSAQTASRGP